MNTMTTTILTDEQIGDLFLDWNCFFKDSPGSASLCIRAIEQAVLQSAEIQALRKDSARLGKLEAGYFEPVEGGIRKHIDAAMEKQP